MLILIYSHIKISVKVLIYLNIKYIKELSFLFACQKSKLKDEFSCCFTLDCGLDAEQVLWFSDNNSACGTFILTVQQSCGGVRVFVNGVQAINPDGTDVIVQEGESISITSSRLRSIGVQCLGVVTDNGCVISLCLAVNFPSCC